MDKIITVFVAEHFSTVYSVNVFVGACDVAPHVLETDKLRKFS